MHLISIILLISIYVLSNTAQKENSSNKKDYVFIDLVSTSNYRYIDRVRSSDYYSISYQYITDINSYREGFYVNLNLEDTKTISTIRLKNSIIKGDTLTIGVLKSDFYSIQSYKTSFIKSDFFNREIEFYWIIKKKKEIFNPKLKHQRELERYKSGYYIGWFILISCLLILSAIYYHNKKPTTS